MSRLPYRPSLDHLRKQARERLRQLRQQNPGARLAEAQHAIAREYGFASWPKLKRSVTMLAALPPPITFQRYTTRAREAVFFARVEASRSGSATIEPEHVLLGAMRASNGQAGRLFDGLALDAARAELLPAARPQELPSPEARIATGARATQVFRGAAAAADARQHPQVGLVHLVLGVLGDDGSRAARLLVREGISITSLQERLGELLDDDAN